MTLSGLVVRSSVRNLRRSVSTALAVALAIFVYTSMVSVSETAERVQRQAGESPRLVVHNAASRILGLPQSYSDQIRAIPGVTAVCGAQWFGGYYRAPRMMVPALAVSAEDFGRVFPDYDVAPEALERFRHLRIAALVGAQMMNRFGWHIGDRITIGSTVIPAPAELTIVGVIPRVMDQALFFRLDYFEERAKWRGDFVSVYWVRVGTQGQMGRVASLIDAQFTDSEDETRSEPERTFLTQFISQLTGVMLLVKLTALMVTVAITLVAAAATSMSIRERVNEIAAIRAIGFRLSQMAMVLLGETMLIVAAGCMVGMVAAWAVINHLAASVLLFKTSPVTFGWASGAAMVIGFAAGVVPVSRALSLSIVDGLRFDR